MRIALSEPMYASDLSIRCNVEGAIANIPFFGISTDSREIEEGDLFIAFRGQNSDGNDFIEQAFSKGAVLAVSELRFGKRIIRCDNLLKLLYDMASKRLSEVSPQIVAVTGSVGKTTFLSYASTLLEGHMNLHFPQGNYNTDIGLPITVLGMPRETELLLLELGARHQGDVGRLSLLTKPNIAVITRIGHSHIESFGNIDDVLRAKSEILIGLRSSGTLIYNADDPKLSSWAKGLSCDRIGVSIHPGKADLSLQKNADGTKAILFGNHRIDGIYLQNGGEACELAAVLASGVALKLGVDHEEIRSRLSLCRPPKMRQELFEHNGIQYIFDAYNASPESSAAALRLLCKMQVKGHRIALLGDMLELGRDAEAYHFALGIQAGKSNIDQLYCIGELGRKIAEGAAFAKLSSDRIKTFATAEKNKLIKTLRQKLRSGDVLLLKASRALSLEDVLSALTE